MVTREQLESREKETLAPYAVKSGESRGREFAEAEDPFRTCFQRDRDRIIHSKAFRRLKGKTQVFVAHYGDHYRSRLSHSMEVAQLSRDIARMLNLNEDLAETIGLAHDLGHTPFGHAGQDEMHAVMQEFGERFEHNEQSRRVVDLLEEKSPQHRGLNLSFEVRDGLIKHRTTYDMPVITDTLMPSLEAQIVNMADEIAYQNHDIDDGLRSGLITLEGLEDMEIWQRVKAQVNPGLPEDYRIMAMVSALISLMVNDLALCTEKLVTEAGVKSADEIYQTARPLSLYSPDMTRMCAQLKTYLHRHFYQSGSVAEANEHGKKVIRALFTALNADHTLLPEKIRALMTVEKPVIVVRDYIAGMTDNFALELFKKLQA